MSKPGDVKIVPRVYAIKDMSECSVRTRAEPEMRTNPLSPSRGGPGLLLLLERLGGSPPLRSRTGERPLPLGQFWSSVFIATPLFRAASVGMLMPLLVGAISWDCHAGEVKEAKKVRSLLGSLSWRERSERFESQNDKCVGKKGSSGLKFLLVDVKTEEPLNRSSWSWLMLRTYRHPFLKSRETIIFVEGGGWEIMNATPLARRLASIWNTTKQ